MRPSAMRRRDVTAGLAACALGVSLGLSACSGSGSASPSSSSTPASSSASAPSPSGSATSEVATLNGLSLPLPDGWSQISGDGVSCRRPADKTVLVYSTPPQPVPCPAPITPAAPSAFIEMMPIFGTWGSQGWNGKVTTWKGQPALVRTATDQDGLNSTLMVLPLLNAEVIIDGVTPAQSQQLLASMTPKVGSELGLPGSATRVMVTHASPSQSKTVTDPAEITQILTALGTVTPSAGPAACPLSTNHLNLQDSVVFTFAQPTRDTSFLVTDTVGCSQVTGGNGMAGPATPAVLALLAKFPFPHFG